MAFVELTKEENPKLAVDVNNNINYKTKDGEIKQRAPQTALLESLVEAGKVAAMEKGNVTAGIEVNGKYENFYVNRSKEDFKIMLKPVETSKDPSTFIYINSLQNKETGRNFYAFNTYENNANGKNALKVINGLSTKDVQNADKSVSSYVKVSIRLKNDELKANLEKAGANHVAIVSKKEIAIVNKDELHKKQESQKTAPEKSTKSNSTEKKSLPKPKVRRTRKAKKEQGIER